MECVYKRPEKQEQRPAGIKGRIGQAKFVAGKLKLGLFSQAPEE
jgi:hypothetical protein